MESCYDEDGKPVDVIPEHIAVRRGMAYRKDRHGKVCYAEDEAPLLIDRLYNHEVIGADHHFFGVQMITMRKVFLDPVRARTGTLLVRREGDQAGDKPVPMEDTDYLRALRGVRSVAHQRMVQEVCDEAADPLLYRAYGRQGHAVRAALDALCDAVAELWEKKRDEQEGRK